LLAARTLARPHAPSPLAHAQERIRSGKELAAAKKLEDGLALRRNVEQRQREKEEEQRAKDAIRVKLGGWPGRAGPGWSWGWRGWRES
jgi:hypothetical protein